jgi:hypothetical protein
MKNSYSPLGSCYGAEIQRKMGGRRIFEMQRNRALLEEYPKRQWKGNLMTTQHNYTAIISDIVHCPSYI